jgi:hypothetical protein
MRKGVEPESWLASRFPASLLLGVACVGFMAAALHTHGSRGFGLLFLAASLASTVGGLIGLVVGVPARWRRTVYAFSAVTVVAVPISVMIEIASSR